MSKLKKKKNPVITKDIVAGMLSGFVMAIIAIAVSALVFKGHLSLYLSLGISCIFIGSIVVNLLCSFFSSISFSISRPEPAVGAILAIVFANIAAQPLTEKSLFSTLIATLMLVSLMVGCAMFFLGYLRLGQAVRFLPYPVLGGVIVGSAWIIARSSLHLINHDLSIQSTLHTQTILQLSLAFGLALLLLFYKRFWVLPLSVVLLSLLIQIFLHLNHVSTAEAIKSGWLFSTFTSTFIFNTLDFSMLGQIDWNIIVHQFGYIMGLIGLIIVLLLLNISGIETAEKLNTDVEHELKIAGIANILGGLFFAFPCNLSLSGTLFNRNVGATSHISGIIASGVCLAILFFNSSIISYLPIPVIVGLLLSIAFKLMHDWLYNGWYELPHMDYLILISIVFIISIFGFLPGIFIGLVITCISFVIRYAKIDAIKYSITEDYYHSNVIRPFYEQKWLMENGHKILIFKLQGYLFFGSTKLLLDRINHLIEEKKQTFQFLIFDFQLVNGLDSSANFNFIRLQQLIRSISLELIFTHCSQFLIDQFYRQRVLNKHSKIRLFPDIDQGLEWCEQELLKQLPQELKPTGKSIIVNTLNQLIPNEHQQQFFAQYLEKFEIKIGEYLFRQGDPSDSICFIESGEVSIFLKSNDREIRLAKSGAGTIIGEIGFYLGTSRTASVRAEKECSIYKLAQDALIDFEKLYPEAALIFHKKISFTLAQRLTQANYLIQILSMED